MGAIGVVAAWALPRRMVRAIASRSTAWLIAWRTRLSSSGFRSVRMPMKMIRAVELDRSRSRSFPSTRES
jgi:hypothetical protein